MYHACIVLADGFEEVEAVTPIDYLRRAGFAVKTAGLAGITVEGAHGIQIQADTLWSACEADAFDVLVLPGGLGGGKGAKAIAEHPGMRQRLRRQLDEGRWLAAICAAPALVLGEAAGVLQGRAFTCYPGMEQHVPGGSYKAQALVVDGKVITAAGPACAQAFALAIIEQLAGAASRQRVAQAILAEPER